MQGRRGVALRWGSGLGRGVAVHVCAQKRTRRCPDGVGRLVGSGSMDGEWELELSYSVVLTWLRSDGFGRAFLQEINQLIYCTGRKVARTPGAYFAYEVFTGDQAEQDLNKLRERARSEWKRLQRIQEQHCCTLLVRFVASHHIIFKLQYRTLRSAMFMFTHLLDHTCEPNSMEYPPCAFFLYT